MTRRFWVYIEQEDGKVHPVAWELLGVARRLADEVNDKEAVVEGILVGSQMEAIAEEAIHYGAQTVYMVDDPVFKNYLNKPYTTALTSLVKKYKPEVFLVGATTLGRDLAGAVATSLGTGLTADTTHLAMGEVKDDPKKLLRWERDCDHYLPQSQPPDGHSAPARVYFSPAPGGGQRRNCPREDRDYSQHDQCRDSGVHHQ
jgi:electron transfer flavoprotein alpha subunit